MNNLITDIPGVLVGAAHDAEVATGVSVVIFEEPAIASIAIHGGAPGVRDAALLEPEMTVPMVDALRAVRRLGVRARCGGRRDGLARQLGRGHRVGPLRVPIVPGAILFDLLNGGDKNWGRRPPYWELGFEAAASAAKDFVAGHGRRRLWRDDL